jgi:hypothetical protein
MHCPRCGTEYAFFEKKCTRCDVDLVEGDAPGAKPAMFAASTDEDESPKYGELPEATLVSVFKTSDPGLLPLATMALEGEDIEYFVKNAGKSDSLQWMMSQDPTTRPMVVEIMVGSDVASKARDLLVDLENPTPSAAPSDLSPAAELATSEPPTITLEDAVAGTAVGAITESQLQELTSRLEEEGPHEYFLTGETVDRLQTAGADAGLIDLLRQAVGADGSGRAIRWVVR